MKKSIVFILFVMLTSILFAENNEQDVIYLKNGGIIRGRIIETIPNRSVRIETVNKKVLVFQIDRIEKITKEAIKTEIVDPNNKALTLGPKGIVEFAYQGGSEKSRDDKLNLNFILGNLIHPNISIGIGSGVKYYFESGDAYIPLFADFRTILNDKKLSPYFSLGIGYTFKLNQNHTGEGIFINPTAGLSFKPSQNSIFNIGFCYEIRRRKFWQYPRDIDETSGAFSIVIGIVFIKS